MLFALYSHLDTDFLQLFFDILHFYAIFCFTFDLDHQPKTK
jgi:hypothetical protein